MGTGNLMLWDGGRGGGGGVTFDGLMDWHTIEGEVVILSVASYADVLLFLLHDEPKECLRRRLYFQLLHATDTGLSSGSCEPLARLLKTLPKTYITINTDHIP